MPFEALLREYEERRLRAMAMGAMDSGSGPAVELQPEDIVITAAVEARFAAS